MPRLSTSALVLVWERGVHQPPLERGLVLLAAVAPDRDPDTLRHISVRQRDAELLAWREETFGRRVEAVADCVACGELLELGFDTSELDRGHAEAGEPQSLVVDGSDVRFRLPTSADLAAAAAAGDVAQARETLLERCVAGPPGDLAASVRDAVVERMAELDPLGGFELELQCPACGHAGPVGFDVASFVWTELEAASTRALEDVHALASAYGWREADVLALSGERRQLYLELIG